MALSRLAGMAFPAALGPAPDHVRRFWRALDLSFDRVEPTPWGAVVTDRRFPAVWDANYARVDVADDTLTLTEVERSLLPALRAAGATTEHVVSFYPDPTAALLRALEARGHTLTWDLVMDRGIGPSSAARPDRDGVDVEAIDDGPELWTRVGDSLALFEFGRGDVVVQLIAIERDVLPAAGKRWFGIRDDDGALVSLGAVMVLEGVGYVDNVVTFPHARGRGLAGAVTASLVRAAAAWGATNVCLLADPQAPSVVRMYERLGFRGVGMLAATRGPAVDAGHA